MMQKQTVLGINVTNASSGEVLQTIAEELRIRKTKLSIVTPNPEIIMASRRDSELKAILNHASIALADGIGLLLAAKFLGKPLKERITGTDFMVEVCKLAAKEGFTVGFLGARDHIAKKTAEKFEKQFPNLEVAFAESEWPKGTVVFGNGKKEIDILFVAFGFPKQEKWISENLPQLPVRAAMTVGGAFDYLSGNVKRAPLFLRTVGLEWLFRLLTQPWRIKRQLSLISFILLVLKEKFSPSQ